MKGTGNCEENRHINASSSSSNISTLKEFDFDTSSSLSDSDEEFIPNSDKSSTSQSSSYDSIEEEPVVLVPSPIKASKCSTKFMYKNYSQVIDNLEILTYIFVDDQVIEGQSTRARKRKPESSRWARNESKKRREQGLDYVGYRKEGRNTIHDVPRAARKLGPTCTSKQCRRVATRNCATFLEADRVQIFERFWKESTWDQRRTFVVNHVIKVQSQRKYTKQVNSRRTHTFNYFLTLDSRKLQVCKTMFLNTTGLKEFTVHSWVQTEVCGMSTCKDVKNQKRSKRDATVMLEQRKFLEDFLDSFPKLPSHYARHDTNKLYFEPLIKSKKQLYNMYSGKCAEAGKKRLSVFTFYEMFADKNLSILKLKKDKCDLCHSHEIGSIPDEQWMEHCAEKNRAREELKEDTKLAKLQYVRLYTMDLEAVKVCPYVQASAIFYKTKLCCHNFTVYENTTHKATCYWFDETAADMTASTFASCLIKFLTANNDGTGTPIIFYSDGCTYQNRNNILANALLQFAMKNNVEIMQKFLVVGHTQMPCDSVHAMIEKYSKKREVYMPYDYIRFTREARSDPFPYDVVEIHHTDIKDYRKFLRYSSIRPGKCKNEPTVTDIRALFYKPDGQILYKLHFDDLWNVLPQPMKEIEPSFIEYPSLYRQPRKIKLEKYKHLQELKKIVPNVFHHFYDNLVHE